VFRCEVCSIVVGPKVKANKVVNGIRHVEYHNEFYVEDEYGVKELKKVDSIGTEITGETLACDRCAGVEVQPEGATVLWKSQYQEKVAEPLHVKLAAVTGCKAIARASHKGTRAKRDIALAIPIVKKFIDENKDFTL